MLKTNLGRLRLLGLLEGISYLLLLGICMPLKYLADIPEAVYFMGMAHGALFIGYCLWIALVWQEYKQSFSWAVLAFVASLLPFGTFVADKKLFQTISEPDSAA